MTNPTHPKSAPRLYVVLARKANVGVIVRRGPSAWVQLIKWDTQKDTFEKGQWFHGRIFEESCDVSPDGKHFLYNARKLGAEAQGSEIGPYWTAVSHPPYFTAVALWSESNDETKIARATWCDWDHAGRLVYARDGKLFAVVNVKAGIDSAVEVGDFNSDAPEQVEPPDWAKVW